MESSNLDRTIARAIANNAHQLSLFRNRSATLPDSIGDIKSLEMLYLSRNRLERLPESIGKLSKLAELNLSHNQLSELPECICNLSKLRRLHLQNNRLMALPESIGRLAILTHLNLENNQLTSLPASMKNISNLQYLNLNGNALTDLSMLPRLSSCLVVWFMNADLPRQYWTKFSDWKPEWLLFELNVEIARLLVEHVGYEKISEELQASPIDSWREYTLLQISWTEPIVLLKMTCPSTGHIHILRVPPQMISAQEAITWVNHGIHPDRFAVQT